MSIENLQRSEIKYLISQTQFKKFQLYISTYLVENQYYKSSIKNIYYDTDDYLLIRRSIDKPTYKEKIRIRTYEEGSNPNVFVEIKKKYNSIVYKRRIEMKYLEAIKLLNGDNVSSNNQIIKEIQYAISFYKTLKPMLYLSYNRLSYNKKEDENFRITFDYNITYQQNKYDFICDQEGKKILDDNYMIMEIKTDKGYPMWLNEFLCKNKIYKTSFSKYGNAYKQILDKEKEIIYGQTVNIA